MPEIVSVTPGDKSPPERPGAPDGAAAPLILKQGIAALAPVPLAQGGFGQVYLGKILNPLGLLAERIVWGEESPRLLGCGDIPYEDGGPDSSRLPTPILVREHCERVYEA